MSMRHRLCAISVVLFGLATAAPAPAHHSFSGVFNVKKQIALKGVISKIDWVNPHIYVFLDVKDNDGKVTTWAIESLPTNHLRKAGITRQDIWNDAAEGEVITIHAYEAHDPAKHMGWLLRITYADGHFLHVNGDPKAIASN